MRIFKFIKNTLIIIKTNPPLGCHCLFCKCRVKLPTKDRFNVIKKIGKVNFDFRSEILNTNIEHKKELFFDCYELPVIRMMKAVLRKGDTFIDVGANIGYISAIAMNLVGPQGQVHAFEPVRQYFKELKKLQKLNEKYRLHLNNVALGNKNGQCEIYCTKPPFIGGSTLIDKFLIEKIPQETKITKIIRLDEYIEKNNIKGIKLIKIDVEGYEFPVLSGLEKYFKNSQNRPIIICEIVPSAYTISKLTRSQLITYMKKYDYRAYNIVNEKLSVNITKFKMGEGFNVVFMSK
jgi:FkbM family methyltransferase